MVHGLTPIVLFFSCQRRSCFALLCFACVVLALGLALRLGLPLGWWLHPLTGWRVAVGLLGLLGRLSVVVLRVSGFTGARRPRLSLCLWLALLGRVLVPCVCTFFPAYPPFSLSFLLLLWSWLSAGLVLLTRALCCLCVAFLWAAGGFGFGLHCGFRLRSLALSPLAWLALPCFGGGSPSVCSSALRSALRLRLRCVAVVSGFCFVALLALRFAVSLPGLAGVVWGLWRARAVVRPRTPSLARLPWPIARLLLRRFRAVVVLSRSSCSGGCAIRASGFPSPGALPARLFASRSRVRLGLANPPPFFCLCFACLALAVGVGARRFVRWARLRRLSIFPFCLWPGFPFSLPFCPRLHPPPLWRLWRCVGRLSLLVWFSPTRVRLDLTLVSLLPVSCRLLSLLSSAYSSTLGFGSRPRSPCLCLAGRPCSRGPYALRFGSVALARPAWPWLLSLCNTPSARPSLRRV